MTTLRLGTRKSLLAWSQSSWVAREIERLNPNTKVELVGIETQGDKILDKPLSQIDGKEFFTAELDHALLRSEVDCTVHSMKDLSLDRPEKISLAAIPARELPHDVIVFHQAVLQRILEGKEIRMGTSSPRRLTLIPEFLKQALPHSPKTQFIEIRGNVNTRLGRIHEDEKSEKKLDGVVLAFAGLERLAINETASAELQKLLQNTKLMVLPIRECPTAPAQGALAIEARTEDLTTLAALKKLHDPETLIQVQKERVILREWGGGCHQKLGATAIYNTLSIRGLKPSGEFISENRNPHAHDFSQFTRVEAADVFDFKPRPFTSTEKTGFEESDFLFIAHSRAYDFLAEEFRSPSQPIWKKSIWVSGTKSWFKLAQKGVWVEGCLEGRGFETLREFQDKKLLQMQKKSIAFLSHGDVPAPHQTLSVASYQHFFREIPKKVEENERIFWTSGLPFEAIWSKLASELTDQRLQKFKNKTHACGAGRTAAALKAKGISPLIAEHL